MRDWPEELPNTDPFFPIIMNDWMGWEDLDVLLNCVEQWIASETPNITLNESIIMTHVVGVS
jgi:hypothetical protein